MVFKKRQSCLALAAWLSLFLGVAVAGESPYSPAYLLPAKKWQQDIAISYSETRYDLSINSDFNPFLNLQNTGYSQFVLLRPGTHYAFNDNLQISIAGIIAHAHKSNPLFSAEGKTGFRSPRISMEWRDYLTEHLLLRTHAGLQINPATSSRMNSYYAGARLILPLAANKNIAIGWLETQYENVDARLSTVDLQLTWPFKHYLITTTIAHARLGETEFNVALPNLNLNADAKARDYQSLEFTISRPVGNNLWLGLHYYVERSKGQYHLISQQLGTANDAALQQQVTLSARFLF